MKRTEKTNIGGSIFHMDEDAYQRLIQYLNRIKSHFAGSTEGDEIIKDIEFRIAELIHLKLSENKQVISLDDVVDIIGIMGKPEDFFDEESSFESTSTAVEPVYRSQKRFYRDVDQAIIGGVCSGLAAHFNIDVVFVRILFVVLAIPSFGFSLLLYLVLWVAMPGAYTTADKVAMRGGDYKISDIENSVKKEFDQVKDNLKNYKNSQEFHSTKRAFGQAGSAFLNTFGYLGRIIISIIGLAFVIAGIGMLISFMGVAVFSESIFLWNGFDIHHLAPDFLTSVFGGNSLWVISICLTILIGLPLLAIIYWGLKLILRFKANDRIISLFAISLWIISLVFLTFVGIFEARDLVFSTKADQTEAIRIPRGNTLFINSTADYYAFDEIRVFDEGLDIYTHEDYPERIYFSPNFSIEYTQSVDIILKIEKEARGANSNKARQNASDIHYEYNVHNSNLYIDPFFYHEGKKKWAFSKVKVTLLVPEGQNVYIDNNLRNTINEVETSGNIWTENIFGETWEMTRYGLDYEN